MSALACVVGLVRDTTGHDWHASGKLFVAEILLTFNFGPRAQVKYRTRKGKEVTIARGDLALSGEALLARDHLLRTAKQAAELGAWCGKGAEALGLEGAVDPDVFRAALEGEVPDGSGQRLGRRIRDGEIHHRPGRDLTFSAPSPYPWLRSSAGMRASSTPTIAPSRGRSGGSSEAPPRPG